MTKGKAKHTIFEDTREARLYQDGKPQMIAKLRHPQQLCNLLDAFFSHTEPACPVFDYSRERRRFFATPHCEAHYDHA